MVLIFSIAAAATAAIKAFNRLPASSRTSVVAAITQSTSVVLALTSAIQWVLAGLQGLSRLSQMPQPSLSSTSGSTIRIGRPAGEAEAA